MSADKDVEFSGPELGESFFEGSFAAGDVSVESGDAGVGKLGCDGFFDFFGSDTEGVDFGGLAFGTGEGGGFLVVAVVTAEFFILSVEGEGDGAVGAGEAVAAFSADDEGGEGTSVEEEDGLGLVVEGFLEGLGEFGGEDAGAAVFVGFSEVDDVDGGEVGGGGAGGEVDAVDLSGLGLVEGFDAGGSGAEDEGTLVSLGEVGGEVFGLVAGGVLLFIAGFVLFVHDDKADVVERGEEGGAGSEDDGGFSGADA